MAFGSVYEKYIKEHLKNEAAQTAVERAVIIMKRWGIDNDKNFHDCLENISNRAVHFIRSWKTIRSCIIVKVVLNY